VEFRKQAIDKVSSPEQLDLLMQVTSPMGWLALTTVAVVIFVVLVWSVVGSIPDLVDGQGVLIRGERLNDVVATATGTLLKITVSPDTDVTAGQVIAVISKDKVEIEQKLALKKEELARIQAQNASSGGSDQAAIARNQGLLGAKQAELASLRQQRKTQEELVNKGLKAANVLFDYDRRITGTLGEIASIEGEKAAIQERMGPRQNQEAGLAAEIEQLNSQLLRTTAEITSPQAGRVVEVIKSASDKVREGEPLIRLEMSKPSDAASAQREYCGGNIHMVMYVSGQLAGKVRPGQPARISPTDVKKEEFGYIMGQVAWVSSFAASPDDMREKLKNDNLVRSYNSEGPVFETRVCLTLDKNNKINGFKWSSSAGPPKKIESGALATSSVVVDERRPYAYVIPAVKHAVGM
jgi:HlyD family secretion protein